MQSVRGKPEDDVAFLDFASIDHFRTIHHANNAARQIVFPFAIHPRHLCCFTADQRASSRATRFGKTGQQLVEHARIESFRAYVIEKEKRTGAENCDVVHAMIDQICADGVMLLERKRDLQFRSNAINAGDQYWLTHPGKLRSKETTESANFSKDFSSVRAFDAGLDIPFHSIAEVNVDSGARVSFFLGWRSHWMRRLGCRRNAMSIGGKRHWFLHTKAHKGPQRGKRVRICPSDYLLEILARCVLMRPSDVRAVATTLLQIREERWMRDLSSERFGAILAFLHDVLVELGIDCERIFAVKTGEAKFV